MLKKECKIDVLSRTNAYFESFQYLINNDIDLKLGVLQQTLFEPVGGIIRKNVVLNSQQTELNAVGTCA